MTDDGPQHLCDHGDRFLERVGRFDLLTKPGYRYLFLRGPDIGVGYDYDILDFTIHSDGTVEWDEDDFPRDTNPTPAEICDIIAACARYNYKASP